MKKLASTLFIRYRCKYGSSSLHRDHPRYCRIPLIAGLIVLFVLPWVTRPAIGQNNVDVLDADQALRQGITAYGQQQWEIALRQFETILEDSALYKHPQLGSASFWLGLTLEKTGAIPQSHTIWRMGIEALSNQELFDSRLTNAYVNSVFSKSLKSEYQQATRYYQQLISQPVGTLEPAERALIWYHLSQAIPVVPQGLKTKMMSSRTSFGEDSDYDYHIEAGSWLAAWWRGQDPFLATPNNERLEEHLVRVMRAVRTYPDPTSASGFDARGEIYVRLGRPTQQTHVSYNKSMTEYNLSISEMPLNEFWVYRELDRSAYYLFVEEKGRYRQADTYELLPETMRSENGLVSTNRRRSSALLGTMLEVYRELAIHPYFSSIYDDLADAVYSVSSTPVAPETVTQDLLQRINREEAYNKALRASNVPQQVSYAYGNLKPLTVPFIPVRFLNPDGTTRLELYWSHLLHTLAIEPAEDSLLSKYDLNHSSLKFTGIQFAESFLTKTQIQQHYQMDRSKTDADIPVQSATFQVTDPLFHLQLQWEQSLYPLNSGNLNDSIRVKTGLFRLDSLTTLPSNKTALLVSDLLPGLPKDSFDPEDVRSAMTPYPFGVVSYDNSLAVYFETYNLQFDSNDQTRYTVAYELTRSEAGRRIRLRPSTPNQTSAQTTYTGSSRTARDVIFLDFSEWETNQASTLTVTVRIKDEVSGQEFTRELAFDLE